MPMPEPGWVDAVLQFWFHELEPKDWWRADPSVDERVRVRFASLLRVWCATPPDAAALDARGHGAAVIVLDQFSRHLHRGSARAFACDPAARALALDAIARGMDDALSRGERQFLYMPLMHGEDAASQALSLEMFTRLGDRDALRSAAAHARTFARFGRFPYRNAALGRESTAEELAFLAQTKDAG